MVTEVLNCGGDLLLVRGRDDDGNLYEATGWVSALTNHYDAAAYSRDDAGELVRDEAAKPRIMSPAEIGDYATRLLLEQNPELAARVTSPPADVTVPPSAATATPVAFVAQPIALAPLTEPAP